MNNIQLNKYFNLKEFECPCCKTVMLSPMLLHEITRLRYCLNEPIKINSGYRCPSENTKINGDVNSFHMKGLACDITVENIYLEELFGICKGFRFTGIGLYTKKNFLHLDVRPGKRKIWKDTS